MSEKKHKPMWVKKIEFAFLMLGVRLIEKLSVKQCYALADRIGALIFLVDRKHRNRAVQHVLHSGLRTSRPEAVKLAKASFQHMIKVFMEIVKAPQLVTAENFHEYYEVDDRMDPAARERFFNPPHSQPSILATGHIGNWELAGSAYSLLSGIPLCSIMRPLENELIGNFFYSHRAVFNHTTVSKENGLRPLLKALLGGKSIAIVADQHASHSEGVVVDFLGHPARAHMTPALLGLKTQVPITCAVLIRKDNQFHFKMVLNGPVMYTPTGDKDKDIQTMTQLYTDLITETLKEYPEQWLWPHRRWLDCNRNTPKKEV